MMVEGSFESIIRLLRDSESLPRLARVQRLRLAQATDRGRRDTPLAEGTLRADLVLDAFYGKPEEPAPASSAGSKGGSK